MKSIFLFLIFFLSLIFVSSEAVYSSTITGGFFYDASSSSIVSGKSGLQPGVAASSSNFTNNTKGITGVKLDFDTISSLSISEFDFHFGNNNDPDSWTQLSLSNLSLNTISNEAIITWDEIILDGWLELKYSTNQYLYFGNLVGDANLDFILSPNDLLLVQSPPTNSDQYDINGDGFITPVDSLIIINRLNGIGPQTLARGPFEHTSSPVPEPATIILLSSGIIGLAGFRRKFKN